MWGLSVPIKLLPVLVVVIASTVSVVLLVHQSAAGLMAVGLVVTLVLGHRAALQLRMAHDRYLAKFEQVTPDERAVAGSR